MNHVESSTKIYFTDNYSLFRIIDGNREINTAKISRIENEILHGVDVLRYCPIIVQEKVDNNHQAYLEIIDGQHRFYVAKNTLSRVWYVLVKTFDLKDIASINSNSSNWKAQDYINCYLKQKNPNYETLNEFLLKYQLPLSVTIKLLSTGNPISTGGVAVEPMVKFRKGLFVTQNVNQAVEFCNDLLLFSDFKYYRERTFVGAIYTIIQANKIDIKTLAEKVKQNPKQLSKEYLLKDYLEVLENIASIGSHQRVAIY